MTKQANKTNEIEKRIHELARLELDNLFDTFESSNKGLSNELANEKLDNEGENIISADKKESWIFNLAKAFINPFNIVLFIVATVTFISEVLLTTNKTWATVIMILSLIIISALMQFVQETRSNSAAEKLKKLVASNANVSRDNVFKEIPIQTIVKGDIVRLSAGDMIPADLRILSAKDLFISQSSLTGESEPVEKFNRLINIDASALDSSNICFMGSNVISGNATAIAIGCGDQTYIGSIAKSLSGQRAHTNFEKGLTSISKLLLKMTFILVPIILIINGVLKHDWVEALLFALAVAVGITPELLPMIMTSTLAKGAISLSKHKTIVKNISSIQSFGAMDVLCTDKTGTLTEDKIILQRYLDIYGKEDIRVLRHAYLNSWFQTGLKNLLDIAVIERAEKENYAEMLSKYKKIDEIPFDFSRRRMSVVLEDLNHKKQLITKGAVEEMLECCSYVEANGKVIPLNEEIKKQVLLVSDDLNSNGLRVVAVAQKNNIMDISTFGVKDENEMVLIGYIAFLDPPKESSKVAIKGLHDHGVRVVVLTGDNEKVAASVCRQVGLNTNKVLLGSDVEKLSDEILKKEIEEVNLFAKLSPGQKMRIVTLLQENGHTVGYLGDGINDAMALNQADVGISVDSAVDIAKESADIILLQKSLTVLEEGVIEGRRTFGNLNKYIKMATSGNFGNMISLLFASLFLPFLPILPVQILAQNLLYDTSQIAIPFDRMDKEYYQTPQNWDPKSIKRFMLYFGLLSSIFDILTFMILFYVFKANNIEKQAIFQTGWFMVGLASQTLVVHLIRTSKIPFIESRASKSLIFSTLIITCLGLLIPYTFIGHALDMTYMDFRFIFWFIGIILMYSISIQILKKIYIKKYNSWV